MKKKELYEAIRGIDESYLLEACPTGIKGKARSKTLRISVIAAIVCCLAVMFSVFSLMREDNYTPPVYQNAYLSAEDVSAVFLGRYYSTTSQYNTVKLPEGWFYSGNIENKKQIPIYKLYEPNIGFDMNELSDLRDGIIDGLADMIGLNDITLNAPYVTKNEIRYKDPLKGQSLIFTQTGGEHSEGGSNEIEMKSDNNGPLIIYGAEISLSPDLDDSTVISSLGGVCDGICGAFSVKCDSVDIRRLFLSSQTLYLTMNVEKAEDDPYKKELILRFEKTKNENLCLVSLKYRQSRTPSYELYSVEKMCEMISPKEAEELLFHGYVFGGVGCSFCRSKQEEISFEEYDHVRLEYLYAEAPHRDRAVPFYCFYKKITTKDGYTEYAYTYVCAVPVSGLARLMQEHINTHGK